MRPPKTKTTTHQWYHLVCPPSLCTLGTPRKLCTPPPPLLRRFRMFYVSRLSNKTNNNMQNDNRELVCLARLLPRAGRSSEVERSLMVRWVVGSILHGVDPLSYFSFQPVLHDWCNKGRGMCYPVCGMVHIKEPLLLIDKSSLCGGSGFPFSLSEWSLTICLTPYNRR